MDIRCTGWKPYVKNTLLGFANLELTAYGLTVREVCLHEKEGSRWASLPARPYQKDSQTVYANLFDFASAEAKGRFQAAALRAIDDYQNEQPADPYP